MLGKFWGQKQEPKLEIAGPVAPKFKVGDLVNYEYIPNVNYMAIINDIKYENNVFSGYIINIIDSSWVSSNSNPLNITDINFTDIGKLKKIALHPEYNSDLNVVINQDNKVKRMIELKIGIKALQANINFINKYPDKFSDLAIRPKIEKLANLRTQLNDLYNTSNEIESNYFDNLNIKLYGKIVVSISNFCDSIKLSVNDKEQIIKNFINVCNSLLSFTIITLGLNILYYRFYGKVLILSLFDNLPEDVKTKIKKSLLEFLTTFIVSQQKYLYHLCNTPGNVNEFYKFFKYDINEIKSSASASASDSDISREVGKKSKRIDDDDDDDDDNDGDDDGPLSQDFRFENEACVTFQSDIKSFEEENAVVFKQLNEQLSYINNQLNDINNITLDANGRIIYLTNNKKGGKRNKKTRKINKKRRLVRKTKKTNKSYKKNKKHNTKKRNTKRR